MHVDAVVGENLGQPGRALGAILSRQEVVPNRTILTQLDGPPLALMKISQQRLAVLGSELRRGQTTYVMVPYAIVKVELGFIAAVDHQASHAGLLPEYADPAPKRGPLRSVAGIEGVEHLSRRVAKAVVVEMFGLVAPDAKQPLLLLGQEEWVHRVGWRREVIGLVTTHLVRVDVDLRLPLEVCIYFGLRLDLAVQEPVPVHVEVVVVGASAGPILGMFAAQRIGLDEYTAILAKAVNKAVPAVGVLQRIDDHNQLFQLPPRFFPAVGQQVIRRQQGRIRRRTLVPVDVVSQPQNSRSLLQQRGCLLGGGLPRIAQ